MTSSGEVAGVIGGVLGELPLPALRSASRTARECSAGLHAAVRGSGHEAPKAALDRIGAGIEHTDQAIARLALLAGKLTAYLAILAPGGTDAAAAHGAGGERRPSIPGPAGKGLIKSPHHRHHLNKIGRTSRPKEKNTVILPGTDVAGDIELIRLGRAQWLPERNGYQVNGRLYGIEENGTTYPVSGPGLVELTRPEYQALKGVIEARGDMTALTPTLTNNPGISDADWAKAAEVYQQREDHRREGAG